MQPREYLSHYAKTFRTVEVDSTYHAVMVEADGVAQNEKTPAGFVFAATVPQVIAHDNTPDQHTRKHEQGAFKSKGESGKRELKKSILRETA
jgi:uncharacterized protein YecE (DUF72 family)